MSSGERKGSRGAGGHTVMILDQSVDEGHEFLIYAFQDSDDPAASRIILTRGEVVGMRGVTTMLEGGKFKIGTLQNDINASFKVKVASVDLAEDIIIALVTSGQTQDLVACSMLQNLINGFELIHGTQTRATLLQILGRKKAISFDPEASRVEFAKNAKKILDPFFSRYFSEFFGGSKSTRILEAFSACVPTHAPSLSLQSSFERSLMELSYDPSTSKSPNFRPRSVLTGSLLFYKGHLVCRRTSTAICAEIFRFCRFQNIIFRAGGSPAHVSRHLVFLSSDETANGGKSSVLMRRTRRPLQLLCVAFNSFLCICVLEGRLSEMKKGESMEISPYLIPRIKTMIGRFQRLNLRDQLDALIKLQVGDTVEGKVLDPGWTTRSKIKKGRNPAMSKPSTILDGPYNNLLQYVSVHKSQGLIVSSRPTSFSKIVALFMEKILAMQEAFQKDLFLMSSTHDGQQKGLGIQELSMRIRLASENNKPEQVFWVAGRRSKINGNGCFICFDESIPQDMVDVLFKVNYGM